MQAGLTRPRTYRFPDGSRLAAKSFTAFYADVTGLTLSNTGSQVKLLGPTGNSIAASEAYATAKDGQAWALAKGKWYWTTTLTPNAANIIKQPAAAKSSSKNNAKTTSANRAQGAKPAGSSTLATSTGGSSTPVHIWTLVLLGVLALLYAAYEYRSDLANRIHEFRRNLGLGCADR